jgi:hypothetical protein
LPCLQDQQDASGFGHDSALAPPGVAR